MANGASSRRVATNAANELTEVMIAECGHNLQWGRAGWVQYIYAAVQLQCQPLATAHSLISPLPPPTGCTFQFNCRNTFTPFTYAIIRHYTTRQSLIHYGRLCVYVARKVAKVIAGFPGRALTPPVVVYIIKHLIYWQSFLACECASSTVPCHAM